LFGLPKQFRCGFFGKGQIENKLKIKIKNIAIVENIYYIAVQLLTILFTRNFPGRHKSAIIYQAFPISLPFMYYFGINQVLKYCVIAGLLLRNWCVFDSGNFCVVRDSFTAFCSPEGEYSGEILCIVPQSVWKDKDKKNS
jgi:hypothetical protein